MEKSSSPAPSHPITRSLAAVGAGALLLGASAVLLNLLRPSLPYSIRQKPGASLDSNEFLRFLSIVTDGTVRRSRLTRLKNGTEFYPAELEAIRGARNTVNLEYYEFAEGRVSTAVLDALIERAHAGVEVRLIVDAAGSFHTRSLLFQLPQSRRWPDALVQPSASRRLAKGEQPYSPQADGDRRQNGLYRRCGHCRPLALQHSQSPGMA
jgi:hypothetical protein